MRKRTGPWRVYVVKRKTSKNWYLQPELSGEPKRRRRNE